MQTKKRNPLSYKMLAIIAAVAIHALIIAALIFNFSKPHTEVEAAFAEKVDIVKATTIDESQIQQQIDKLKQKDLEKKRKQEQEQERIKQLQEQAEQEKQKIEDLKQKQEQEKEKTAELEKERKAIALKKKQEEEKRKKEKAEREEKEKQRKKKLAEQKRKQEQERKRKEKLAAEQALKEQLDAEEAFLAEQKAKQRATTLLGKYTALIKRRVAEFRTIAPDFGPSLATKVNVKLSSSGDVRSVRIVKSSDNPRYDKSVETAIYQASPLPIPSQEQDPEVNKLFQDLNITFDMSGL